MRYYAKISINNKIEEARERLINRGAGEEEIVFDMEKAPKRDDSLYTNFKNSLLREREALTIDTISSLGKNYREIAKELQWFNSNSIPLYIADLDFTYKAEVIPYVALEQLLSNLAEVETKNVKGAQKTGIAKAKAANKSYGRPRIAYPDNWERDFLLWKNGNITATEFMARSGLKKGTFYNLIKEYKRKLSDQTESLKSIS